MNCHQTKDILRYHNIDCYTLHPSTSRKIGLPNLFKCVSRQDHSGVPLKLKLTGYTVFINPSYPEVHRPMRTVCTEE